MTSHSDDREDDDSNDVINKRVWTSSLYVDTAVCGRVTWSRSLCTTTTSQQVVVQSSTRTRRSVPAWIHAHQEPATMSR